METIDKNTHKGLVYTPDAQQWEYIMFLPWPPTVNTYWRHAVVNGASRVLISSRGRRYRKEVANQLLVAPWALKTTMPLDFPVRVEMWAYPPDKRKRDLDNLPKAIFDSLQHAGVWFDDNQIDEFSIKRCTIEKPGFVTVRITKA